MKLQNKVALVVGGASGIGRASSVILAQEGAKVMIADVLPEKPGRLSPISRQKAAKPRL